MIADFLHDLSGPLHVALYCSEELNRLSQLDQLTSQDLARLRKLVSQLSQSVSKCRTVVEDGRSVARAFREPLTTSEFTKPHLAALGMCRLIHGGQTQFTLDKPLGEAQFAISPNRLAAALIELYPTLLGSGLELIPTRLENGGIRFDLSAGDSISWPQEVLNRVRNLTGFEPRPEPNGMTLILNLMLHHPKEQSL